MAPRSSTASNASRLPSTQLQGSQSLNTSTVQCAFDYFTCNGFFISDACRCDEELCTLFGDCCAESQYTHNTTGPEFACVSTSVFEQAGDSITYWMVASCPRNASVSAIMDGVINLCEAQSLTSPPVSDNRTGLVYRNRYCAQCHGVPDKQQMTWRSQWRCNDTLQETFNSGNSTIDAEQLLNFCNVSAFVQPASLSSSPLRPRTCSSRVIYTCQPPPETDTSSAEYRALSDLCRSQLVDVRITGSSNTTLYKNEFCARCSTFGQDMKILCPPMPEPDLGQMEPPPPNTFAILLDITGSGKVVIASENIVVTSMV